MQAGAVDTLLVLDANPAYDAPARSAFARALRSVPACRARRPARRRDRARLPTGTCRCRTTYEQWGDALAHDGSATLLQPAIAPLYDTRSPHELLALLAGDDDARRPRARAAPLARAMRGGDFDAFWRDSLRAASSRAARAAPLALPPPARRPPRPPDVAAGGWSPSSRPTRRRTTAASPTTAGCRSCRGRSPSSPGTTPLLLGPAHGRAPAACAPATSCARSVGGAQRRGAGLGAGRAGRRRR